MVVHTSRALAALAVSTVVLAGCSGGAAPPANVPAEPKITPLDIANPIMTGLDTRDACRVLTSGQITTLLGEAAPGTVKNTALATICQWSRGPDASIRVQLNPIWDWLSHAYVAGIGYEEHGTFVQQLAPVQGYPVFTYGEKDLRPRACHLAVGVRTDAAFEVDSTVPPGPPGSTVDACETGRRIADAVVTTLKGGA